MSELEPVRCGCGGEAKVRDYSRFGGAFILVECERCGMQTDFYNTEAEAIEAWNRAMGERMAKVDYRETKMGFTYRCCSCDNHIDNSLVKYCPHCGARLEWK